MSTHQTGFPRWDCRNEREQNELKRWTLEQLRLLDEPTGADIQFELDLVNDDSYANLTSTYYGDALMRGRIINAIRGYKFDDEEYQDKAPNFETLVQLIGNEPKWFRFALQQLWQLAHRPPPPGKKDSRGRKPGEPRPTDYTTEEREKLDEALHDVSRIRWIWKHKHPAKRQNRTQSPTAEEIAAERHCLDDIAKRRCKAGEPSDPVQLLHNWRKSRT
jgi:hypothetical protein